MSAIDSDPAFAAATEPPRLDPRVQPCPLCDATLQIYMFSRQGAQVRRCAGCGLTRLQRSTVAVIDRTAAVGLDDPSASVTERTAAEAYLAMLRGHGAPPTGMLVVAAEGHAFVPVAEAQGVTVARRLDVTEIETAAALGGPYESAVVLFQLGHASDPVRVLQRLHDALVPGAAVLIVTPSLDSWPARFLRSRWTEWRPDVAFYFDEQTLQSACLRGGFAELEWAADRRRYTLQHVYGRAAMSPRTALTRLVCGVAALVPAAWRSRLRIKLPTSGVVVKARRVPQPPRPRLSIVMPVYNERATFERTIDRVLAKECPGVDKEVVIVESHSTDGTRELVRQYDGRPGVSVILEDRPRGKGAAVRVGLRRATGTIVLIQDADCEYDIDDYDALLEPILRYRRAFVLGSRHIGSWKVRTFSNQPAVTAFFNVGHVLFGTALNLLYGQQIKDPFTMYKVFRRDCLHGVKLECNRFDFDFELVIKLLRKGYVPLEVPVNYDARSFKEGKKVSALRDPLTWIRALVKYRFVSIYETPGPKSPIPNPK